MVLHSHKHTHTHGATTETKRGEKIRIVGETGLQAAQSYLIGFPQPDVKGGFFEGINGLF